MLLVFVGGKSAPSSYILGKIYDLPARYEKYPYFRKAPADKKEGDMIDIPDPEIPKFIPPHMPRRKLPDPQPDMSISLDDRTMTPMIFIKTKGAPGDLEHNKIYVKEKRYLRFGYFIPVPPSRQNEVLDYPGKNPEPKPEE